MKKLLLAILLLPSLAISADLYADVYRFDNPNFTGSAGLTMKDYNVEYSFSDSTFAIGERKYISFTNIEIGLQGMVTNKVKANALDHRVIDIEGGWHITVNPYFKAGSKLFVMIKLDESNKAVVQFGFNLF